MNILKRQLALLLVLAMTLIMLPMPAHADEATEQESPSAIVEETAEKPMVSNEGGTDTENKPVESAEPDAAAKENAGLAAETPKENAEVSENAPVPDSVEDAEVEENTDSGTTVESEEDSSAADSGESEEAKDSETDTQEETDQVEPETDVSVTATFSLRRSAVNAVATDCEHENTTFVVDSREDYWYYLHTNEAQHVANYYAGYKCDDCGVMVSQVRDYFAEDHVMNENSVCTLCGYGTEEDSCAHSETEVAWDTNYTVTYTPVDATQHKVTGYQYTYCTNCFDRVGESFTAEESEDHTMNDEGKCSLCGYTASVVEELQISVTTSKSVAELNETVYATAVVSGGSGTYRFGWTVKNMNGQVYSALSPTSGSYSISPDTEGVYTFFVVVTDSDGMQASAESNPVTFGSCTHENTETAWDTTQPVYYSIYSATQHRVHGFEYTYCTNCFERIGESSWSEQLEDHTLDADGVCDLCSYGRNTCTHENVINGYAPLYDPPRYEQYNDTQHFVYHTMQKTCLDCNEKISEGEEALSLENHVLDDGKCTYCGYGLGENYCTHPATDIAWDTNYSITYTKINNEELSGTLHQAEGYQYHYCTSCYKRICDSFPVAEWENHTFDTAGDCTLCDYRVGCAHSETTMKLYDTLYESLNKDSHEVTRLYSKVCADSDCGKVLVSVETSYTENETEDHDFEGNTCTLCGYTVAQLQVTVNQTINTEDHISVTASVVGGTGGYKFNWKILKDGSIGAEFPTTFSASCGTSPWGAGSYVFEVTVEDSSGNTVTAQSSAFTVGGHTCEFKSGSNTVLVNQSLTHHTVETTTYEECSICHEKRNEVNDVQWVEHTPIDAESYGHEAAHDHKKYFICECGAHPYLDGEYVTANGTVQDEAVCCICHGHKYGEEEETPEGTRQKTCENCGLATVTHTHDYKLVETTKLVIQSETHHTVETTTYEECTSCHEKRNEATNKEWVEHTPMNKDAYGYEASHTNYHQKYFICICGAHPYIDGEYETANGKVQESDVCCICHGHKYGEAAETADGTWKKTCANCGLSQKVAAPVQPTEPVVPETEPEENGCNHVFNLETTDPNKHPHTLERVCIRCQEKYSQNFISSNCCQCVGHDWGKVTRLPDGKTYKVGCFRCNKYQEVIPSNDIEDFYKIVDIITERHNAAKDYQDKHELDSSSSAIWKTIAGQATDKLSEGGFVGVNEVLNTYSDMTGSIKGVFEEDDWNQQQIDLWESLLIELLKKEYKAQEEIDIKSEDIDYWSGIVGTVEKTSEFVAEQLEDNKDAIQKSINELDQWILDAEEKANILLRDGDVLASNDMLNKSYKLKDLKAEYEKSGESTGKGASSTAKWMKGTALLMDAASIIAAGTEAESAVRDRNNALMDLLKNDQSFVVLSSIIASADAAGEDNLKEAAEKLKTDLEIAKTEAFSDFFSENDAFWKGAGLALLEKVGDKAGEKAFNYALTKGLEKAGVKAAGTVVKDSLFFLSVIESGAKGLKAIVDWGDAYTEAQKLMTINYMDARLNVANFVLEQQDPYIADLWGMLNAEGCVQAQVFLKAWEDGTGLNSKDFGIDNGGWFRDSELPVVLDQLDEERDFYIDELDLPLEKSK